MTLSSLIAEGRHRLLPRLASVLPPEQAADVRHRLGRFHPWETGFDLTAPPTPDGEATGPPDFVGVGAPMAGSRWWAGLIADHPGVTGHPELGTGRHYLSHFAVRAFGADDIRRYHDWFPRRPGTITGEWTPTYLGDPWVPPLLRTAAPEARALVLVRDPVTRLRVSLARSVDGRTANAGAHMAGAVDRGFYAVALRRLLDSVPADRVLVLQYERCRAEPLTELATTYRFLGLGDDHRPPTPGPGRVPALPRLEAGAERRLVDLYAEDVAELAAMVPTLDLGLWPLFAAPGS